MKFVLSIPSTGTTVEFPAYTVGEAWNIVDTDHGGEGKLGRKLGKNMVIPVERPKKIKNDRVKKT